MTQDDVASLSYEQALAELDQLIARLEGGAVELDEAIACYERGSRLAQRCGELLDRTEQRVMQLVVGGGGRVEERPLPAGGEAEPSIPTAPPAGGDASRPRPIVPPPPGAPLRARPVPPPGPPGLFPGLEPSPASGAVPDVDPDEIPF